MYFHIDYNCSVNQLYHKTIQFARKEWLSKRNKATLISLCSRGRDFSRYRVRISPTLPGLVSPEYKLFLKLIQAFFLPVALMKYVLNPKGGRSTENTSSFCASELLLSGILLVSLDTGTILQIEKRHTCILWINFYILCV